MYALHLSVVRPCNYSRVGGDCSAGALPRPCICPSRNARFSLFRGAVASRPRVCLGKNVLARIVGLLFQLRDLLPGASKSDRAPHGFPSRGNRRLDRALPLFLPNKRLRDEDALTFIGGPPFRLVVSEKLGLQVEIEPFDELKPPVLRISWLVGPHPSFVSEKACAVRCPGSFISLRSYLGNGGICGRRS